MRLRTAAPPDLIGLDDFVTSCNRPGAADVTAAFSRERKQRQDHRLRAYDEIRRIYISARSLTFNTLRATPLYSVASFALPAL